MERREVQAAVDARRELGPAYEDEIVDSLLAKIDQRLAERKAPPPASEQRGMITPLVLGALGAGVGATAIVTTHGQAWLAVIIWVAIAWAIAAVARYR